MLYIYLYFNCFWGRNTELRVITVKKSNSDFIITSTYMIIEEDLTKIMFFCHTCIYKKSDIIPRPQKNGRMKNEVRGRVNS